MSNPITRFLYNHLNIESIRDVVLILKSMLKENKDKNEIIKLFDNSESLVGIYSYIELCHSELDNEKTFYDFFIETLEETVDEDYDKPNILDININDMNNIIDNLQIKINDNLNTIQIETQICNTKHLADLIEIDCGILPNIITEDDIITFMINNSYLPSRKIRKLYANEIIPSMAMTFVLSYQRIQKTS